MEIANEFIIGLSWFLIFFGLKIMKDYTITAITSFCIMAIGVSMMINPMNPSNLINTAFGAMHITIGFYLLIRGGTWEQIKGLSFKKPVIVFPRKKKDKVVNYAKEREIRG